MESLHRHPILVSPLASSNLSRQHTGSNLHPYSFPMGRGMLNKLIFLTGIYLKYIENKQEFSRYKLNKYSVLKLILVIKDTNSFYDREKYCRKNEHPPL